MKKVLWAVLAAALLFCGGCGASGREGSIGGSMAAKMSEGFEAVNDMFRESAGQANDDRGGSDGSLADTGNEYDRYFLTEGNRYYYGTLTPAERIWYADIENILGSMEEKRELSLEGLDRGLTQENIDHIFDCVMMDHPELFFVEGYVYGVNTVGSKIVKLEFSGSYNATREESVQKKAQIDQAVEKLLRGTGDITDDYEKIKYVYETLILETDYDMNAPDNQNIYSVFVGKLSVCQGYAKATQYLLNRLGVESTLVSGVVYGGGRHGWNLVKSNGDYYYVDTTWGDVSFQADEGYRQYDLANINYDYLCVTTEELNKTHHIDAELELPECTAISDNYFVREGAYFSEMNEDQLTRVFAKASEQDDYRVTLKCANQAVYEKLLDYLIGEDHIFQYYEHAMRSVVYVRNDEQYSMTFWMTNS